jgi:hypothetical protein
MLVISAQQMRLFQQAGRLRFEDEMVTHSRDFAPRLCEVIGEAQLRVAVRSALDGAERYGFTNRGPARLYVELIFLCGSGFDTDPQYPSLGRVLREDGDQMRRADTVYEGIAEYQGKVAGVGARNVHAALRRLATFVREPIRFSEADFVLGMLAAMAAIFPEKAAYTGEANLTRLIGEAIAEAADHHFESVRAWVLLTALKFAFGHGCTDDPLYPWISRTLSDTRISGPVARAARLERKAVTWLDHVVERQQNGLPT